MSEQYAKVCVGELDDWILSLMFKKFHRDISSILVHLKPVLQALSDIEQKLLKIGLYLKDSNNKTSDRFCSITNLKNILFCINELVDCLLLCVDYDLLVKFITTLSKVLENIKTLLHPFAHFRSLHTNSNTTLLNNNEL